MLLLWTQKPAEGGGSHFQAGSCRLSWIPQTGADAAEIGSHNSSILQRSEESKQFPPTEEKKVGLVSKILTQPLSAPRGRWEVARLTSTLDLGQQRCAGVSAAAGQLLASGVVQGLGGMSQGGISPRRTRARLLHKSCPGGVDQHQASLEELHHPHPPGLCPKHSGTAPPPAPSPSAPQPSFYGR